MGAISGDTIQPGGLDVVVLHWLKESDRRMQADTGLAVPALCGAWVMLDMPLTEQVQAGNVEVDYLSCIQCDLLADLGTDAMTA